MGKNLQSVIFIDLDHTILRGSFEYAVFSVVCDELAEKSGLAPKVARRLVTKESLDRQKTPNVPATRAMDWDDIVSTVADRLGVRLEANIQEIVRSHKHPPRGPRLLDNADKVLRQLSSPHRAIVVATNGLKKYQIPTLETLDLIPLFTDILTPCTNNALKHNIAFYGRWPQLTHLQIMVGDDYEYDVLAPHQFGFRTVWRPRIQVNGISSNNRIQSCNPFDRPSVFTYQKGQLVRPDAIILALNELTEVIVQLEDGALQTSPQGPYSGQVSGFRPQATDVWTVRLEPRVRVHRN